jgi:hypothetical protein
MLLGKAGVLKRDGFVVVEGRNLCQDLYRNHGNKPLRSIKAVYVMTILKWSRHKLFEEQPSPFRHVAFQEKLNRNAKTLDVGAENV